MKTHELKSWPEYFSALWDGRCTFDLRINDRDFKAGDILWLREWDDMSKKYTGRELRKRVTYVLEGIGYGAIAPVRGLFRGYTIVSLVDETTGR